MKIVLYATGKLGSRFDPSLDASMSGSFSTFRTTATTLLPSSSNSVTPGSLDELTGSPCSNGATWDTHDGSTAGKTAGPSLRMTRV
jgi:hypothetical protein